MVFGTESEDCLITWVWIQTLPESLLNLSRPHCLHLLNGDMTAPTTLGLFEDWVHY